MLNTFYYIDDVWLSTCDSLPDSLIGIRERNLQNKIEVYPNPIRERFTLRSSHKKDLTFRLYDSFGRISTPLNVKKTRDTYEIIVGDIPKGIYFLKVDDGKETTSIKLLKQ
jgi:hypothetical protein